MCLKSLCKNYAGLLLKKNKIIAAALFVSLTMSASNLFSAEWYDCIDQRGCRELARVHKEKAAVIASSLLGEYLRAGGEPLDMNIMEEAESFVRREGEAPSAVFIHTLIFLVMKDVRKAGEALRNMKRDSPSYRLLNILAGRDFSGDQKKPLIPFLALRRSEDLLQRGEYLKARDILKSLRKRYPDDLRVIFLWAASRIGSGMSPASLRKKSGGLFENIDRIEVREGSIFLAEWARYEMKRENMTKAEKLLTKAAALDPKNPSAHRLLALVYLSGKKDIPKATASLKNYLLFSNDVKRAQEIRNLGIE